MAIAGGTAAVAGVLVGMTFTFYPHTGPEYLIVAFGVVIVADWEASSERSLEA